MGHTEEHKEKHKEGRKEEHKEEHTEEHNTEHTEHTEEHKECNELNACSGAPADTVKEDIQKEFLLLLEELQNS